MDGDGEPEEYAVQMRRVPDERTLPRLIERGAASDEDVRRVARTIAAFHAAAERSEEIAAFGRAPAVLANWHETFEQTRDIGADHARGLDAIHAYVTGSWRSTATLQARVDDVRARRSGDLRCDSIAITRTGASA
jgi:aminoglycoside phosphotransferase family enzyme